MHRPVLTLACCFAAATAAAQEPVAARSRAVERARSLAVVELGTASVAGPAGLCFAGDGRHLAVAAGHTVELLAVGTGGCRVVATVDHDGVLAGATAAGRVALCSLERWREVECATGRITRDVVIPQRDLDLPAPGGPARLQCAQMIPGVDAVCLSIDGPLDLLSRGGIYRCDLSGARLSLLRGCYVASAIAAHGDGGLLLCAREPVFCGNARPRAGLFTVSREGVVSQDRSDLYVPRSGDFTVDGREFIAVDGMRARRCRVADGALLFERWSDCVWFRVLDPVVGIGHDGRSVRARELGQLRPQQTLLAFEHIAAAAVSPRRDRLAVLADSRLHVYSLQHRAVAPARVSGGANGPAGR